jgi:cytochrome c
MMRVFAIAAIVTIGLAGAASAQDLAAGETSFKKCLACHAVGETAKNKVGPVLNGLPGRKSGTIEGYNYSEANKNSGITWDEATFKDYIKDPRGKIPGTKMVFPGIKNETEITNLWAYLASFDASGKKK